MRPTPEVDQQVALRPCVCHCKNWGEGVVPSPTNNESPIKPEGVGKPYLGIFEVENACESQRGESLLTRPMCLLPLHPGNPSPPGVSSDGEQMCPQLPQEALYQLGQSWARWQSDQHSRSSNRDSQPLPQLLLLPTPPGRGIPLPPLISNSAVRRFRSRWQNQWHRPREGGWQGIFLCLTTDHG